MILGWLSPSGELVEADYMEHYAVAGDICEKYYQVETEGLPDEYLIDHGWVHIGMTTILEYSYWIVWKYSNHLTQAQKDFLRPIVKDNWDWINKSCKHDLIDELELDLEKEEYWNV